MAVPGGELTDLERKAVDFLLLANEGRGYEALGSFAPGCIHHNPFYAGTMEILALAMSTAALSQRTRPLPERWDRLEIKHVVSSRDVVSVHTHLRGEDPHRGILQAHFFRFQDGRIVEYWDIRQVVPPDSPNPNGPI
jgi:predicted SnoaL-like aldol condensation-catalyzing enzyme